MTEDSYGWRDTTPPHSLGYLAPAVIRLLRRLDRVATVLDLGAGNGSLCAELGKAGFSVVGMEPDAQGVEIARREYPNVRFYCIGVEDDPTALLTREPQFDAVVSTEVIEHLFAPHRLPRFAATVLKPGGYLIVSTPYHGYLKNLALSIFNKWDDHHTPLWHGGHIKFWSRSTLGELLLQNGFELTDFDGVGRLPYLWKSMILIARKRHATPAGHIETQSS